MRDYGARDPVCTRTMYILLIIIHVIIIFLDRPDEIVTPKDDPIVQEISDVLKEWSLMWKRLYAVRFYCYMYMYMYMHKRSIYIYIYIYMYIYIYVCMYVCMQLHDAKC